MENKTITLLDIYSRYAGLMAKADEEVALTGTITDETERAISEILDMKAAKVDNTVRFLNFCKSQVAMHKLEIEHLRTRIEFWENAEKRIKARASYLMSLSGERELNGELFSFGLRKAKAVQITDLSKIPGQYVITKTETIPDKKAIREAIEAGLDVPGATLVENTSVVIKG